MVSTFGGLTFSPSSLDSGIITNGGSIKGRRELFKMVSKSSVPYIPISVDRWNGGVTGGAASEMMPPKTSRPLQAIVDAMEKGGEAAGTPEVRGVTGGSTGTSSMGGIQGDFLDSVYSGGVWSRSGIKRSKGTVPAKRPYDVPSGDALSGIPPPDGGQWW